LLEILYHPSMIEGIVVVICIVINAVLAALEIAFVSLPTPVIRQSSRLSQRRKDRMLAFRDNPERTLSAVQIGITLVGALSGAVGGVGAAKSLSPWLIARTGLSEGMAEVVMLAAVVVPLTYFTVILGELVPKSIALKNPLRILQAGFPVLVLIDRVLSPVVSFFEWSTKAYVRFLHAAFPLLDGKKPEDAMDIDSLSELHQHYVFNLVNLQRKKVRDAMVPWEGVVALDVDMPLQEVLRRVSNSGHTRLPVMERETIRGILHSKEFHLFLEQGQSDWLTLLREPVRVEESDELVPVLRRMQDRRSHMAIVGDLKGLVTLEDIVEEIFGDLFDEDDDRVVKRLIASRFRARPQR
jgi:putative hemolysin